MKSFFGVCITILFSLMAFGCKPGVPSKYIQPDEMEDILYDYHLAGAMARNSMGDSKTEYAYRLAALKKHGVSQAHFDSSMVYYMQNTNTLREIYQRLSQRLENEELALGGTSTPYDQFSLKGDTANVWNGDRSFVLTSQIPYNMYSFEVKADTAFHKGDRFLLEFDTQFIYQEGVRDAVVVLALTLSNDSVVAQTTHVSLPSHFNLQVADYDRLGIKRTSGYFLLNNENAFGGMQTALRLLPVYNVRLIKMHVKAPEQPKVPTEPTKTDTAATLNDNEQWKDAPTLPPTR